MDLEALKRCLADCLFSNHARQEMEQEPQGPIRADEVIQALQQGEIITEYPEDKPYSSCLVLGKTSSGRALHVVCAPVTGHDRLIVITAYQPDPRIWETDFRRKKP